MSKCWMCGREFNLTEAKRSINRRYGAGAYEEDFFTDQNVCKECALQHIEEGYAAGAEIMGLMGTGWDDDY